MMDLLNTLMEFWNEYYPVVVALGTSIVAIGGLILGVYLKLKPVYDAWKDKMSTVFNKVTNVETEDISAKLQSVNIEKQITDLKEKINNPLTSDEARVAYTTQLEVLLDIKLRLENGLAKAEDTTSKF